MNIENILWEACNILRGSVSPSKYKDYIIVIFFLKYLSDEYIVEVKKLKKEGKSTERTKIKLDEKSTFNYLYEHKEDGNIGELIDEALLYISNENDGLKDVFNEIKFNSDTLGTGTSRNNSIKGLLTHFYDNLRDYDMTSHDEIGKAYIYFISKIALEDAKDSGQHFTPTAISSLLSKLVDIKAGNSVYDPTCGTGSLLIEARREAMKDKNSRGITIYGQERNIQTSALAKINMYIHNALDASIVGGESTLTNPSFTEDEKLKQFDTIVANPPFSLKTWGADKVKDDVYGRFKYGLPNDSNGDWAFVSHMIASLNAKGTCAVVVPHGVLFRGGVEGKIREGVLKDGLVETIIGLPEKLFFGTSIPVAIMVLNRAKKDDKLLFVDASKLFTKYKKQNVLEESHIEQIVKATKDRKDIEKFASLVGLDEIEQNEYNLNIPRYVDTFEQEEEVNIKQVLADIKEVESKIETNSKKIDKFIGELV